MQYFIGETVAAPSAAPVWINESSYREIEQSSKVVSAVHQLELKFQIIIEAFRSFESELFKIALNYSLDRNFDRMKVTEIYIKLNHQVLSLLTAARSYHDQRPQDLRTISTAENLLIENSDAIFESIFDTSFDYRIMEALRNHAQHHRLPISSYGLRRANVETEAGLSTIRCTIDPKFQLEELSENKKIRKKTRDEIRERNIEWVDSKYTIREYVAGIVNGHNAIRLMLKPLLEQAYSIIRSARESYRGSHEDARDARFVYAYSGSREKICEEIYLGNEVLENLVRLTKLQPALASFSGLFISTEALNQHPNHPSSMH